MIMLILPGFKSVEAAMSRSQEIARANGLHSPNTYWFRWIQLSSDEWGLEVSPEEVAKITEQERNKLMAIQQVPIQAHPTPIYRYLSQQEYVDNFFNHGQIRISTVKDFAKHPDERFVDNEEGNNILAVTGENSTLYSLTEHGQASYIMSCSLLGPWANIRKYRKMHCYEITNPWQFAIAIAGKVNNCSNVVLGPCSYINTRVMVRNAAELNLVEINNSSGQEGINQTVEGLLHHAPLFRKPIRYKMEFEYRLMWLVNREVTEPLILNCPEAVKFCRRLDPADFELSLRARMNNLWHGVKEAFSK